MCFFLFCVSALVKLLFGFLFLPLKSYNSVLNHLINPDIAESRISSISRPKGCFTFWMLTIFIQWISAIETSNQTKYGHNSETVLKWRRPLTLKIGCLRPEKQVVSYSWPVLILRAELYWQLCLSREITWNKFIAAMFNPTSRKRSQPAVPYR